MSQDPTDQSNNEEVAAKKPAKGVYLLPNSFTTASLFSGFYAVVAGMSGDFEIAISEGANLVRVGRAIFPVSG